jgi:outer membrane protein OmpA-like peptidoglycan-associated protein
MIRNHLVVGLAAVGILGLSGLISGCGHTEVAAVVPAVPAPVVTVPAPVAVVAPPAPRLAAVCDAQVMPQGHLKFPNEVEFEIGKSTLKSSPTTGAILQCLVDFLNNNKMVTRFRIEGHTDNAGDAAMNMTLSQQRAEAIVAWMVSHGVNPSMLWAKGYGPTRPIAPNDTPEHMAQNRRVEFHIDELNGAKATKEAIVLAMNPPATVVTTAVVTQPTIGVAVPTVGVAVPAVAVTAPGVSVGVVAPGVGIAVVPGGAPGKKK